MNLKSAIDGTLVLSHEIDFIAIHCLLRLPLVEIKIKLEIKNNNYAVA
jgi:hypothetical protein